MNKAPISTLSSSSSNQTITSTQFGSLGAKESNSNPLSKLGRSANNLERRPRKLSLVDEENKEEADHQSTSPMATTPRENTDRSPTASLESSTNMPINLNMHHQNLLNLESDSDEDQMDFNDVDDDPDQIMAKQEMIYNLGGEGSKSKISAYELYRFMEWVISAILGLLFTIWAFVPEEILASKLGMI